MGDQPHVIITHGGVDRTATALRSLATHGTPTGGVPGAWVGGWLDGFDTALRIAILVERALDAPEFIGPPGQPDDTDDDTGDGATDGGKEAR